MMKKTNELTVFQNDQFGSVRVIEREGEPWFVAADVCRALEITNPSVALERLDDDEKMTLSSTEGHSGQRGGAQLLNIVNEPGMYALVLGSRKRRIVRKIDILRVGGRQIQGLERALQSVIGR